MSSRVWLRRAYEPPGRTDGYRVLVDRLWPRGVSKTDLRVDEWMREIAPSSDLRRWFGHDPERWPEFRRRYRAELDGHGEMVDHLADLARRGRVTLVYSARDEQHNDAVVLRELLDERVIAH